MNKADNHSEPLPLSTPPGTIGLFLWTVTMDQSVGIVETQYATFAQDAPLQLESGKSLGPITVAYETYGQLNDEKSNAILVCHALSGDAHAAGRHSPEDRKPGWWDTMIGPGKAFDTDRYFVICSNFLGGCKGTTGPSSINPETGRPYGLTFPVFTIGDMVEVQRLLLDHLGIERLLSMAGGSMGGMQVLEWSVRYPERMASAMPLATTSRLSAQGIAFDAVGRNAIMTDPKWNRGDYYDDPEGPARGLAVARMIGHITYLSEESMHRKFGRRLQVLDEYSYDFFETDFQVESYLDYQGRSFVERFDANTYLYVTKAMDYFNLADHGGSLEEALSDVTAKYLVMSFSSDWLFPTWQSKEIVKALVANQKDVSFVEIESDAGHDAFLLEVDIVTDAVSNFLKTVEESTKRVNE